MDFLSALPESRWAGARDGKAFPRAGWPLPHLTHARRGKTQRGSQAGVFVQVGRDLPRAWVFLLTLVRLQAMESAVCKRKLCGFRIRLGFLVSPLPLHRSGMAAGLFSHGLQRFGGPERWQLPTSLAAETATALSELFSGTELKPCGSNNIFQRN